ncbi:MAG: ribosome recycling factor [Bacillota bacterium]|jgi:ribosome recycling factor|nr:ribosome recycling factor [Clostridia bacterium]
MIREIVQEAEEKMNKTVDVLKKDFASLRAGRATPALLDKIQVDYYGALTPVNQMANINVPEARLLVIQPWDKSTIPAIEKAILKSDLGLNPSSDGNVIRIGIPQLTEERRKELVKVVRKKAEEARVAIRNVRRDVNDMIKELEKEHEVSEDESKRALDEVQKVTDKFIKKVDEVMNTKEKEIMEV